MDETTWHMQGLSSSNRCNDERCLDVMTRYSKVVSTQHHLAHVAAGHLKTQPDDTAQE